MVIFIDNLIVATLGEGGGGLDPGFPHKGNTYLIEKELKLLKIYSLHRKIYKFQTCPYKLLRI